MSYHVCLPDMSGCMQQGVSPHFDIGRAGEAKSKGFTDQVGGAQEGSWDRILTITINNSTGCLPHPSEFFKPAWTVFLDKGGIGRNRHGIGRNPVTYQHSIGQRGAPSFCHHSGRLKDSSQLSMGGHLLVATSRPLVPPHLCIVTQSLRVNSSLLTIGSRADFIASKSHAAHPSDLPAPLASSDAIPDDLTN